VAPALRMMIASYGVAACRLLGRGRSSVSISRFARCSVVVASIAWGFGTAQAEQSIAREWNDLLLDAIRVDTPRPTVHARNLWHTSAAMYDAWAAYDGTSVGYFIDENLSAGDVEAARTEAISYAAYRLLSHRFAGSPGAGTSLPAFQTKMTELGFDPAFTDTNGPSPAALGNRIGQAIINHGLTDGANEASNYADTSGYAPVNPPMVVTDRGTTLNDPNRWQPLVVEGVTQQFLTPHWDQVEPFAMTRSGPGEVYLDPGAPPQLGGVEDAAFKDAVKRVIRFSSHLDPTDGVMKNISPAVMGNNTLGTDDGTGHALNPATGSPYSDNIVPRGDWGRALAEFWADGPSSETPPGHWNAIANAVAEHPSFERKIKGEGPEVDALEWDVKLYFALNGAVHDAAVSAWDAKADYDYVRPITMIRHMGGLGQSSEPTGQSYHPDGLPLETGLIEVVTAATTVAGEKHEHLAGHEGEIAILAWKGHPADQENDIGGVGWTLAEDWLPYQQIDFVTPAFAGYTSGHSTFSRAAAEVLAAMTGDPFFPGGLGEFTLPAGWFGFEGGPDNPIVLQWATYFDAADEAGLSRLYGGIHVDADDLLGRIAGAEAGRGAFLLADQYFTGVIPEPAALTLLGAGVGALGLGRPRRPRG